MFFYYIPIFLLPSLIWTLWGCPANLRPLWFFSSAAHEIPSVEIGINLKWMNRKRAIICVEVISCEAPCIITVAVLLFYSVSVKIASTCLTLFLSPNSGPSGYNLAPNCPAFSIQCFYHITGHLQTSNLQTSVTLLSCNSDCVLQYRIVPCFVSVWLCSLQQSVFYLTEYIFTSYFQYACILIFAFQ